MLRPALIYLGAVNLALFAAMGWDKRAAKRSRRRVPEVALLALAAAGGSVGGLLGMLAFRHKTRKPKFYLGLPMILILQLLLAWWVLTNQRAPVII